MRPASVVYRAKFFRQHTAAAAKMSQLHHYFVIHIMGMHQTNNFIYTKRVEYKGLQVCLRTDPKRTRDGGMRPTVMAAQGD